MSEDELPDGVPGFDDSAYDDLRALLAGARVTEPMPAEVAARLDEALGVLEPARQLENTVVPLPRRRTGSRLLVAAAVVGAVAVGGIGLSKVLEGTTSDFESATNGTAPRSAADDSGASAGSTGGSTSGATGGGTSGFDTSTLPALTSAAFAAQAPLFLTQVREDTAYALKDSAGSPAPAVPQGEAADAASGARVRALASLRALGCAPVIDGAPQTAYAIQLDGEPAVLVVTSAPDGSRTAQALSCTGEVLARATLD